MEKLTLNEAQKRLAEIQDRAGQAARKSGREASAVTILGVSKTFPLESIFTYMEAGLSDFGESYVQEALDKIVRAEASGGGRAVWHFIGHLQSNKARQVAQHFDVIHSIDSVKLARTLHRHLVELGRKMKVFVEVNVSGEESKSGLRLEALPELLNAFDAFENFEFCGLMTMPPYDPDPEKSRPFFKALREIRDRGAPGAGLSMGMSGDFEVAVEEGATIVRVGTSLFGERQYS